MGSWIHGIQNNPLMQIVPDKTLFYLQPGLIRDLKGFPLSEIESKRCLKSLDLLLERLKRKAKNEEEASSSTLSLFEIIQKDEIWKEEVAHVKKKLFFLLKKKNNSQPKVLKFYFVE
jgi:hypothetical protein